MDFNMDKGQIAGRSKMINFPDQNLHEVVAGCEKLITFASANCSYR